MNHLGIDYGSKLAGTTRICYFHNDKLSTLASSKKQDADALIMNLLKNSAYQAVFIDAPLSLPAAYYQTSANNFFYREGDVQLKAMSPMFLGGLTARAMHLAKLAAPIPFVEVYPKALVQLLQIENHYKTDIQLFLKDLQPHLNISIETPADWHAVDAMLAWLSGKRYLDGKAKAFGQLSEGQIWV